MTLDNNISIYIHWPFCTKKCPYCSFNSHVSDQINFDLWEHAFLIAIEKFKKIFLKKKIKSIFFGGGTPSTASPKLIYSIINKINSIVSLEKNTEITMEINPSSTDLDNIKSFYKSGVNRISIGVQSFNDKNLKFLGRTHNAQEATKAINIVSNYFDNYSMDLICALPRQTISEWIVDLKTAISFAKNHLSIYQLTFDKGTSFYNMMLKKEIIPKSDNFCSDIYLQTKNILENSGFEHYEISNFASNKKYCVHNFNYWNYGEYLGIGPGAHSRVCCNKDIYDIKMINDPKLWLNNVLKSKGDGIGLSVAIKPEEVAIEIIVMCIRTNRGIDLNRFKNIVGRDIFDFICYKTLSDFVVNGIIEFFDNKIVVCESKRLVTDQIALKLCK